MLTNDVCFVAADLENFTVFAFYGELPQDPSQNPHDDENTASSASDPEAQHDSEVETEPDNDKEMIELAQRQPSKFQQALRLEVRS